MSSYVTLAAFWAADPAGRERSPEVDYGVNWTKDGRPWPSYSLSYIQNTGEVYTRRNGPGPGPAVRVLAIVEPGPDEGILSRVRYYAPVEAILAGWAEAGHDLAWVHARLDAAIMAGRAQVPA